MSDETHEQRHARFARIRRTKWLLRFAPRKASLHRYPLIGRFADGARKRSYLWSFRAEHVRPALYAGSIISFLPIMGVQVPVALLLSLLLRCNFMVFAGLQFITNPFTAGPIYYGTYQLGQAVIEASGFGESVDVVEEEHSTAPESDHLADTAPRHSQQPPAELTWTRRFGTAINALVLGGVIAGAVLGLVLDLLWRFGAARTARHRAKVAGRRGATRSRSTEKRTPPM